MKCGSFALLQEKDIQNAGGYPDALKDLLGETIKAMMETEPEDIHGYDSFDKWC